jgi:ferrochelatase
MAEKCDYAVQLAETGRLIAAAAGRKNWQLVYQSRSGSPMQPWLGPDVSEHLRTLQREGLRDVVIAPIGFVSDHMEVVYDLDIEAARVAQEIGLNMVRARTVGTHPAFVKMIRELILERIDNAPARFAGAHGPRPHTCAPDCCLAKA